MHSSTLSRTRFAIPCLLTCMLVTLTCVLGALAEPARGAIPYLNPKFGFSLVLPAGVFTAGVPQNPEEGGSGSRGMGRPA